MGSSGDATQNEVDLKLNLLGIENDPTPTSVTTTSPKLKSKALTNIYKYRGIFYALISAFIISLTNILIRKCKSFSGSEMALVRFVFQFSIFLPVALYKGQNVLGEKGQRLMLSIRGIFGCIGLLSVYFAVSLINPSDAIALFNCGVIFVTLFARVFLNEKLTLVHLLALICTVFGVFFISQPSFLFEKTIIIANRTETFANHTLTFRNDTVEKFTFDEKFLGYSLSMVGAFSYTAVSIVLKKLANKKV